MDAAAPGFGGGGAGSGSAGPGFCLEHLGQLHIDMNLRGCVTCHSGVWRPRVHRYQDPAEMSYSGFTCVESTAGPSRIPRDPGCRWTVYPEAPLCVSARWEFSWCVAVRGGA